MAILRPFYGWKPELKLALPDLEERGKMAVFWDNPIRGVRVFSGQDSFKAAREAASLASYGDSLEGIALAVLNKTLTCSGDIELEESCWGVFWESFQYSLGRTVLSMMDDWFWDPFQDSLMHCLECIIGGKPEEAPKFKPLLDLWLAGNFPIGFDDDNNLLVVTA
ncbi:MAG: hypothetical protein V1745_01280 [Patescibacteria group bacterium]